MNDTQPYPAGSYKKETEKTKDVEVSFGKAFALPNLTISANASMKPFWYAMMGAPYDLQITNETGVAWYNLPLRAQLESGQGQVEGLPETIPTLLPYQTISYPFHIKGVNWWQPQAVRLTLTVDQLSSTHVLQTGFQIKKLGQTIKDTLQTLQFDRTQLGVGLVIVAFLTGGLLVSGRSRHRPVRRQGKKS